MSTLNRFKSLIVLSMLMLTQKCFAATGGANMPWDNSLTTVQNALTGKTAHAAIVIAIALAGLGFAMGEHGGLFRKAMGVLLGGSIAVGAASFYNTLQIGGALL